MIAITFSTDWAPAPVLQYTLDILDEYGVPATFFCTDDLSQRGFPHTKVCHELAIHPHIVLPCPRYGSVIRRMKDLFPDAVGSRSHRFITGTPVLRALSQNGILYDSSIFTCYTHIEPFMQHYGILQIPVWFSDDIAIRNGSVAYNSIPLSALNDSYRLHVLNFHPVHVYLNTRRHRTYEDAKPFYQTPHKLLQYRNADTRTGVESVLRTVLSMGARFMTLQEVCKEMRKW